MPMKNPPHPGDLVRTEIIEALGLSASKAADILKVRAMLIPGLVPGRQIILDSARFKGAYMITECEYVGQTWSMNWHVEMVVRRFG